jgi:oligopeptide transport system substrate-binding protein
MLRRLLAAATAGAASASGLAATLPATASPLRRARGGNLTTLDPHRAISAADMEIAPDMFEGLTAVDALGAVVPGLASRWEVSSDGLQWRFTLRRGLSWSDGRPLTAADVAWSLNRLVAPGTAALLGYRFDAIRNARALRTAQADAGAIGVAAVDASTVRIDLEHADTDLLKLLAIAYVVPRHVIDVAGREWAKPERIVVCGAFRPVRWSQGGTLSLERNPRYHAAGSVGAAKLDWVMGIDDATRLRLFRAGELDVAQIAEGAQLALAKRELTARLRSVPFYGGGWIGLNTRRPALRDARVRTALAMAVDRTLLTSRVRALGEVPTESIVPDAVADYPLRASPTHAMLSMPQRVARARTLLTAAGIDARRPVELVAIFSQNPLTQRSFLALNAMWSPLGVRVAARGLESRAYNQALTQGNFDLMEYGPFSVVQSAASFIGRFQTGSFLNYSGYSNPEVDRLIALAERQNDPAQRARYYLEAERLLLQDYPVIPLFSSMTHCLVAARVRGWAANSGLSLPSRYLSVS